VTLPTYGIVPYLAGVTDTVACSLSITSVSPVLGLRDGGTLLTITGEGFWSTLADVPTATDDGGSPPI
jgi:hypothetical protein